MSLWSWLVVAGIACWIAAIPVWRLYKTIDGEAFVPWLLILGLLLLISGGGVALNDSLSGYTHACRAAGGVPIRDGCARPDGSGWIDVR